jgi:hypothetical protein
MTGASALARRADPDLTAVAWISRRELDFSDWILQGRRLGMVSRGSQWWLGDWLAYGNRHYGETYVKAAKVTGYDVQSLMNMTYVASRFEISRRRENVPWSHHATLAALAPADQDYWLDRITCDRLSVRCLRAELRAWERNASRAAMPPPRDAVPAVPAGPPAATVDCPACGHTFRPSGARP